MNKIMLIAKKEWRDIIRSNIFAYVLILLGVVIFASLVVSVLVFDSQLKEYDKSILELKQIGKELTAPPPKLYPLNLLRGVVDYIEIVGAVLGILLGYISISKERNTKALKILLTRPITKKDIINGKILGNAFFIFSLMSSVAIFVYITIYVISGIFLNNTEVLKLVLFVILSTMYMMIFFMLSVFFSLGQKSTAHALIITFVIWMVIVLILPQIGDTMDPDNQVPGGFFKSMNIDKEQSKQIMSKFGTYETIRNGLEQMSITKHYERTMFAIFGIKNSYNDVPLQSIIIDNSNYVIVIIATLGISFLIGHVSLSKNKDYLES